jgi:hypothetical protein
MHLTVSCTSRTLEFPRTQELPRIRNFPRNIGSPEQIFSIRKGKALRGFLMRSRKVMMDKNLIQIEVSFKSHNQTVSEGRWMRHPDQA